jgi:hypothetical protein
MKKKIAVKKSKPIAVKKSKQSVLRNGARPKAKAAGPPKRRDNLITTHPSSTVTGHLTPEQNKKYRIQRGWPV